MRCARDKSRSDLAGDRPSGLRDVIFLAFVCFASRARARLSVVFSLPSYLSLLVLDILVK